MNDFEYIKSKIGEEDALCTLAEKAAELSRAALALRRKLTSRYQFPTSRTRLKERVLEAFADVYVAKELLIESGVDEEVIMRTIANKSRHWATWLKMYEDAVEKANEEAAGNEDKED